MMTKIISKAMIPFVKYHGTGNDFVLLDQREKSWIDPDNPGIIKAICDRRFGIGGDGLIILKNHPGYDFEMVYFNSDGQPSSMCGNGGRCIIAFAHSLGIFVEKTSFIAVDGPHLGEILAEQEDGGLGKKIGLKMSDVTSLKKAEEHFELDTGSPHYVTFVEDVDDINVYENGQAIRYSQAFKKEGINVNFVERTEDKIIVLTYERGVEAETFSCGTGVTAAAIANVSSETSGRYQQAIQTKGGNLEVRLDKINDNDYQNIWLIGPAVAVFEGKLDLEKLTYTS